MATLRDIGLAEPSTLTARLAAVTITRNSTVQSQEILVIGDPDSTTALALAKVTASPPPSTTMGLAVRIASGPSSAADLLMRAILPSTAADNLMTVYQSSAADLNVTVAGYSTVTTISTGSVRVHQSTATDLLARVSQGPGISTLGDRWLVNVANSSAADYLPVRLVDSSGTGFLTPGNEYTNGSTYSSHAGPTLSYDNSSNNTYRTVGVTQPLPVQARRPGRASAYSTVVSSASTSFYTVVSSAATTPVVRAYSITSTAVAAVTITFHDSTNNTPLWGLQLGSQSSGVTGANLGLGDGLFEGSAGNPITMRIGTTGVEVFVSLGYHGE